MFAFATSILFIVSSILQNRPVSSALNMDLVIVFHRDVQRWSNTLTRLEDVLPNELETSFDIRDGGTTLRLLVGRGGENEWQFLPPPREKPTGDVARFRNDLKGLQLQVTNTAIDGALQQLENIFKKTTPTRPQVVLVFSISEGGDKAVSQNGSWRGASLREEKGVVFFVFLESADKTIDQYRSEFENLTADPYQRSVYRVLPRMQDFDANMFKNFTPEVNRRLCSYNESCFYADKDRSQCKKGLYTPLNPTPRNPKDGGDCGDLGYPPPTRTSESCKPAECEKVCDDLWPWKQEPHCSGRCGEWGGERDKNEMRWMKLQFCPLTLQCDPCPTTTSTTTKPPRTTEPPLLTWGAIIGIVIPIVVIVVVVAAVIGVWVVIPKKRRKMETKGVSAKKAAGGVKSKTKSGKKKKDGSDVEAGVGTETQKAGGGSGKEIEESKAKTKSKSKSKSKTKTLTKKSKASKKK